MQRRKGLEQVYRSLVSAGSSSAFTRIFPSWSVCVYALENSDGHGRG